MMLKYLIEDFHFGYMYIIFRIYTLSLIFHSSVRQHALHDINGTIIRPVKKSKIQE